MPITAAYGAWKSPVTSEILAQGGLCFMDLQVDQVRDKQDTIYWAELRYAEEGRYVVCSASGPNFDTVVQWTPAGYSARTSLHEYGGKAKFASRKQSKKARRYMLVQDLKLVSSFSFFRWFV